MQLDTRVVIDVDSYSKNENTTKPEGDIVRISSKNEITKLAMGTFKVGDTGGDRAPCPCEMCCMKRPHPPRSFPWTEYDVINPALEKSLELPEGYEDRQHRYLLCTRLLMGFVLKSRTWGKCTGSSIRRALTNSRRTNRETRRRVLPATEDKRAGD